MKWLQELRINKELTQEVTANLIGITRAAYCNIENGERRPSVEIAKKIANLFGFDWTLFYDDTQSQRRKVNKRKEAG